MGVFHVFKCKNGTKSRNASRLWVVFAQIINGVYSRYLYSQKSTLIDIWKGEMFHTSIQSNQFWQKNLATVAICSSASSFTVDRNVFISGVFMWLGYSIFYLYRGMDDQIFKNQYTLERMIVWLINPLEFNLRRKFSPWKNIP